MTNHYTINILFYLYWACGSKQHWEIISSDEGEDNLVTDFEKYFTQTFSEAENQTINKLEADYKESQEVFKDKNFEEIFHNKASSLLIAVPHRVESQKTIQSLLKKKYFMLLTQSKMLEGFGDSEIQNLLKNNKLKEDVKQFDPNFSEEKFINQFTQRYQQLYEKYEIKIKIWIKKSIEFF